MTRFLDDMGPRPSPSHTVNRIDNDGNYACGKCDECSRDGLAKSNCEWATKMEQSNNTRKTIWLTMNGQTDSLQNWARKTGISHITLRSRVLELGWSHEKALTTPTRKDASNRPSGSDTER